MVRRGELSHFLGGRAQISRMRCISKVRSFVLNVRSPFVYIAHRMMDPVQLTLNIGPEAKPAHDSVTSNEGRLEHLNNRPKYSHREGGPTYHVVLKDMMKSNNTTKDLEPVAKEILEAFSSIALAAETELKLSPQPRTDVFANTSNSTFTAAPVAAARLSETHRHLSTESERLRREPAIARVLFHDGDKECVSYICRATPPTISKLDLVSQRAPKGRLAALGIGESMTTPSGRILTVLERVEVHPEITPLGWDSKNNIFRIAERRALTVESLILLLGIPEAEAEDLLAQLLADEQEKDLVREGERRSILMSMELRDQAILDAEQDEIFRLPLEEHIFLSGPPGTGKTTTLIRRLGQNSTFNT